jgi:hypothetical protein
MPKAMKKEKQTAPAESTRRLFMAAPWTARHHNDHSEIEAYIEGAGDWATLTQICDGAGIDAEHTANFIVRAVNASAAHRHLISELMAALKICLETGNLGWKTEYAVELAMRKAEQAV